MTVFLFPQAVLLDWSKNFRARGLLGKDVVQTLKESIERTEVQWTPPSAELFFFSYFHWLETLVQSLKCKVRDVHCHSGTAGYGRGSDGYGQRLCGHHDDLWFWWPAMWSRTHRWWVHLSGDDIRFVQIDQSKLLLVLPCKSNCLDNSQVLPTLILILRQYWGFLVKPLFPFLAPYWQTGIINDWQVDPRKPRNMD